MNKLKIKLALWYEVSDLVSSHFPPQREKNFLHRLCRLKASANLLLNISLISSATPPPLPVIIEGLGSLKKRPLFYLETKQLYRITRCSFFLSLLFRVLPPLIKSQRRLAAMSLPLPLFFSDFFFLHPRGFYEKNLRIAKLLLLMFLCN